MTRTRPTRGRGSGAAAPPGSLVSRHGQQRRLAAAGLAAATVAGGIIGLAAAAQAGTPPTGPGNIEIFNKRSMVALEGYAAQAGQEATVEVLRNGEVIGIGVGTLDTTGFLEFNHPGGECWIGVTPTIKPGDEVKVSFSGEAFTDSAITASPTVTSVTGSGFTPGTNLPTDPENRVRGVGKVTIEGTYDPADPWFDPARFNIETVNPENDDDKTPPGEDPGLSDNRAMGISLVPDAEHPNGEPGLWDAEATADPVAKTITGTYTLYTEADYDRVLEGDHVMAAWMAGEEPALGLTQNEFEEIPGPGMGGCPPSPDGQVPTAPTTAQLSSAAGDTSVTVAWAAPAQPADASEVSGYRVSAKGGVLAPEQEVAERTGGTSVSLDALEAGQTYEIFIEAYNGRWSAAQPVGTIVVGSGTGGGGGGGGEEPPPDTSTEVPAIPAGVSATANADGGADVSWTASEGAASYTVGATSSVAGAATPAPVTVQAPATTASLAGLTPGTAYTVSVTATNAAGTSTAGTSTVTTNPAVAPGAFTLTRVIPGHESITAEWTAAAAGNAASPVTGYELVATPATGSAVKATVTGLAGTVTGLTNGTSYTVTVVAKSGTAATASTKPATVNNVVTPNDVVTVTRAQYRADKREYRISGTAADTTANRVHLRLGGVIGSGTIVQLDVPVAADGTWTVDLRNGPVLPTNNTFNVRSDSGGGIATVMTRVR